MNKDVELNKLLVKHQELLRLKINLKHEITKTQYEIVGVEKEIIAVTNKITELMETEDK